MRLFVAVELPEPIRRRLGQRIEQRRGGFPRASWVRPENLHLTLAFLGEVDPDRLPELTAALAGPVAACSSFAARTAAAGAFPEQGSMRVVWIGLEPGAELAALAARIREAVAGVGLPGDEKPFQPHVTLARCRVRWPAGARENLSTLAPEPMPFAVTEAVLVESELAPGGSRYRQVASFPLAAGAAA